MTSINEKILTKLNQIENLTSTILISVLVKLYTASVNDQK